MKVLEIYRGLYIDLSGLSWNDIDSETVTLRKRHPFLLPGVRFIYTKLQSWRPPTQAEYDRRERERAQLRKPIGQPTEIQEAFQHAKLEWADAVVHTPEGGSLLTMGTCGTTYKKVTTGDRFAAKEKLALRYPEEMTNRECPLRIGTKRIKISGVEYPFIAVSDHWRPSLLHENRTVWVTHYREIKGLRKGIFYVFYAVGKVPYNRLPWTMENRVVNTGGRYNDGQFETLAKAINCALLIVQEKETENQRSEAARLLGQKGGSAKSQDKTQSARANGLKGGRKRGGRPGGLGVEGLAGLLED